MLMHAGRKNTIAAGSKATGGGRPSVTLGIATWTVPGRHGGRVIAAASPRKSFQAAVGAGGGKLGNWRSEVPMEKAGRTPGLLQFGVVSRNCGRGHVTWGEVHPLAGLIEVDRPIGQCERQSFSARRT